MPVAYLMKTATGSVPIGAPIERARERVVAVCAPSCAQKSITTGSCRFENWAVTRHVKHPSRSENVDIESACILRFGVNVECGITEGLSVWRKAVTLVVGGRGEVRNTLIRIAPCCTSRGRGFQLSRVRQSPRT